MPLDAQLHSGSRTCDQSHRVLLGIGARTCTERADVEPSELLTGVAKGGAGFGIDIHNGASFDVVYENGIFRGVENRSIACLRHPQRLVSALAFGNVGGNGERHGVEGAAQPTEFIAPS